MPISLLDQLKASYAEAVKAEIADTQIQRNIERFEAYNARRILAGLEPFSLIDHIARLHGLPSALAEIETLLTEPVKPGHRDNIPLMTR